MSTFIDNLRQEVFGHTIKGFRLENDLRSLVKVESVGASEAVVFYCARIMEAVMKDAHNIFFGNEPSGKLAEIESVLCAYNMLTQNRFYWAKGLRLLGNEVRHSLRRITVDEADCAIIFLEFILNWYFCELPIGVRQTTIYKGQSNLTRPSRNRLLDLAWALNSSKPNQSKITVIFDDHEQDYVSSFSRNLTFPILLVQMFIDQDNYAAAYRLIESISPALQRSRGALKNRFIQLKALLYSRDDKLDEAIQLLEGDYKQQRKDPRACIEVETVGILAGVYKRIWESNNDLKFLKKSNETYTWGWGQSKNPYLGINAAATALWLGKEHEAMNIGKEVKKRLTERQQMIQKKTDSRYDLNYWDLVTLAESFLLMKDISNAGSLYKLAFSRHSEQSNNIVVTKNQLVKNIDRLKLSPDEIETLNSL